MEDVPNQLEGISQDNWVVKGDKSWWELTFKKGGRTLSLSMLIYKYTEGALD